MECLHRNSFCYVCGLFTTKQHSRKISNTISDAYEKCFATTYHQDWYTPEVICECCNRGLIGWKKRNRRFKFTKPVDWLHRTEHSSQFCYFCKNNEQIKSHAVSYKFREQIVFESVESVVPIQLRAADDLIAPAETSGDGLDFQPEELASFSDEGTETTEATTSATIESSTSE